MRTFLCFILLIFSASIWGQRVVDAQGEYIYHAPENVSLEQARQTAIERARLNAIASVFGTDVSQTNTIAISSSGDKSETVFNSLGGTEVKGEWIADRKEPEINIRYESGMLVIEAKVWGKIREKKKADYELLVNILCNGLESEKFYHGDRLSVKFKSPVKGFLAIYLADDRIGRYYCLLPYENGDGRAREIKHNQTYTLLSTQDADYPYREETILTTEQEIEYNRLLFVFSKNQFDMPLSEQGEYLPELNTANFEKWLNKNRIRDNEMSIVQKLLEIKKTKN